MNRRSFFLLLAGAPIVARQSLYRPPLDSVSFGYADFGARGTWVKLHGAQDFTRIADELGQIGRNATKIGKSLTNGLEQPLVFAARNMPVST